MAKVYEALRRAEEERRRRGQDPDEKALSKTLSDALSVSVQLDKLPKSKLEAYVVCLEADSPTNALAAAINCVSLALANSGVEMFDLVAACSAGAASSLSSSTSKEAITCLQPSGAVLESCSDSIVVGYMPLLNQITHVSLLGCVDTISAKQLIEVCTIGCLQVHMLMKN